MQNKSLDFWVGLFVLLGAAALLFLALRVGNMSSFSLNNSYAVTTKFDNIGGLKPRAAVKSSAKILTSGLLGEQYIGIEPGGDVNNLVAGDKIKMTQSAIVLENLISQFLFSKAADGKEENK